MKIAILRKQQWEPQVTCVHAEADYALQGHAIRLHASYFREGPKSRTNRGYAPAKRQAQVHLSAFISIT